MTIKLSLIIPFYNEQGNVLPMMERVNEALNDYPDTWEAIMVNDGSSDDTQAQMQRARDTLGSHMHAVELRRNYGQTAAMQAGMDQAQGQIWVTLDGDLQNDPHDIIAMINKLEEDDLDLLQGWRKNRQDTLINRKIPSRIANKLIGKVTGIELHDYGCSLKVYRANAMKDVRLYGEMHRFIPAWMMMQISSQKVDEMVVNHHARHAGESKYGISRTFRVILDLLFVWFFMHYRSRPGHFFGAIGLGSGLIGSLILMWLSIQKFLLGEDIGGRPLFLVGILLCIAAIQFITTGILAEILSRIYYESSERLPYAIKRSSKDGAS